MTTFDQPTIDFDAVFEPISCETKATVELVGNDWRAGEDWNDFKSACFHTAAMVGADGRVDHVTSAA